jgi:hypothetical protein
MKYAIIVLLTGVLFAADTQPAKPRVFINDSTSWQMVGRAGGARPQTAEIYKTFGASCPDVVVTNVQDRAEYVARFDHEDGKGWARKDTKVAVFNKEGDIRSLLSGAAQRANSDLLRDVGYRVRLMGRAPRLQKNCFASCGSSREKMILEDK